MRIRTRIHLTLGTVLVLHVFTAIMGHVGLQRSQNDLINYEGVNSDTIRILAIDNGIAELQRNVSTYMLNGHASASQRVRELIESVGDDIQTATEHTDQEEAAQQLEDMISRIKSFETNFEKVSADRQNRKELIEERMLPTKKRIFEILGDEHAQEFEEARFIRDHLYQAENAALRYFEAPSRQQVDEAIMHLDEALKYSQDDLDSGAMKDEVIGLISAYESAFLEAVQATQGYMHLVHVVLAGETAELLYQASQIRTNSLGMREEIELSMNVASERFQTLSDWIAVVTVLAGIAMAWYMTRSVLLPILGLTNTFEQLSEGHTEAKIEYIGRGDEIGMMAKAAEVFRVKNNETQKLLVSSQSMQTDLERRNTEMTQFVYTVSHDLKSPLVTIQGFAGALMHAVEERKTEEMSGMVGRIHNASRRMSETLDDLLELSRIGMIVNEFDRFEFGRCCDAVVMDLASLIKTNNASVEVLGGDLSLFADEKRISQILQNLIQNAVVYGGANRDRVSVTVEARREGDGVVISVEDDGPGIPELYQERVFGIFQRLSADDSGTGIGLAIVRKIANAHNGHAWAETQEGGGAIFNVSLPGCLSASKGGSGSGSGTGFGSSAA